MPKLICNECDKELDYKENEFTYKCECGGSLEKVWEQEEEDEGMSKVNAKQRRQNTDRFTPTIDNLEEGDIFVEEVNRGPIRLRYEGILKVINKNEDIVKLGFLNKSIGKIIIMNKDCDSLNQATIQPYTFYRKATSSEQRLIEEELEAQDG